MGQEIIIIVIVVITVVAVREQESHLQPDELIPNNDNATAVGSDAEGGVAIISPEQ